MHIIKIIFILGLLTLLVPSSLLGQTTKVLQDGEVTTTQYHEVVSPLKAKYLPLRHALGLHPLLEQPEDLKLIQKPFSWNPTEAYCELGLFCKWEIEIEKTVAFPVKFRLGEVHYVDRLEGKERHTDY